MSGKTTTIVTVEGLRVWDSRGRPTVEAIVRLAGGAAGRAIAPAGASTGSGEAVELRDGGRALQGYGVQRAVSNVEDVIAPALKGVNAGDQAKVDRLLNELDGTADKGHLGANALIAVSMACAHAAAAANEQPLWRYLGGDQPACLPLPEIQIFGGGAHAGRRVDVQDFMVIPLGAQSFNQAMEWTAEVYAAAGRLLEAAGKLRGVADEGGYWPEFANNEEGLETLLRAIEAAGRVPGEEVAISLDVAASEFGRNGRYRLALEARELDSDGLAELLGGWLVRFPIASIEDPFAEDDAEGFARFTRAFGERVQIVGDDLLVTNAERVAQGVASAAANALLVKPNQAGTLTETRAALQAATTSGWGAIASARSGETEDVTIVHLAVGWGIEQLKVGSFARSERMAKWNEALRIEASQEGRCRFVGDQPLRRFRRR